MARLPSLKPAIGTLRPSVARMAVNRNERDQLRAERPWRKWYGTARWRALRVATFVRDRFTCQWSGCGRIIGDTSALVADHREPHHGDATLFWAPENIWTLCKPCHDGAKQKAERQRPNIMPPQA